MTGMTDRCAAVVAVSDDWTVPVLCGEPWPCAAHPWPAVLAEWRLAVEAWRQVQREVRGEDGSTADGMAARIAERGRELAERYGLEVRS